MFHRKPLNTFLAPSIVYILIAPHMIFKFDLKFLLDIPQLCIIHSCTVIFTNNRQNVSFSEFYTNKLFCGYHILTLHLPMKHVLQGLSFNDMASSLSY